MQNSPARSVVDVGSVIAGTYTIEALIGRGGMGAVFLASHNQLPGKKLAIKLLHAEVTNDDMLARFKREAQIASLLAHPNIVGVENIGLLPDGTPYIVLEYLEGETLAQRLHGGPLVLDTALSIVRQIGSALQAAHRAGIVHRDLKPQNIFLVPTEFDGRPVEVAKVLDFGIAKMRGSQTVKTQDSAVLGTPQYMAPEQATGQHALVDERTDLFALGAIVYEMLAGKPAFDGASIPEVVFKVVYEQPVPLDKAAPGVPPAIAVAVHRALSKQQAERFANVNELVEALTGKPLPERRATSTPPSLDGSSPSSQRKKSSNEDAFAQTMGSGDHADHVGSVRASSPTIDSRQLANASPAPATVASPAKRSKLPMVMSFAGVVVALGATLLVLNFRGGDESEPVAASDRVTPSNVRADEPTAKPTGAVTPQATPEPLKLEKPKPEPALTAGAAPNTGDQSGGGTIAHSGNKGGSALVVKKNTTTTTQPPPPAQVEDDGCVAKLTDAEQALAAKEYMRARQLANTALNTEGISAAHQEVAHAIIGILECVDRNDDASAMTALRQIHSQKLHKRVVDACHAAGRLQGTQ